MVKVLGINEEQEKKLKNPDKFIRDQIIACLKDIKHNHPDRVVDRQKLIDYVYELWLIPDYTCERLVDKAIQEVKEL